MKAIFFLFLRVRIHDAGGPVEAPPPKLRNLMLESGPLHVFWSFGLGHLLIRCFCFHMAIFT